MSELDTRSGTEPGAKDEDTGSNTQAGVGVAAAQLLKSIRLATTERWKSVSVPRRRIIATLGAGASLAAALGVGVSIGQRDTPAEEEVGIASGDFDTDEDATDLEPVASEPSSEGTEPVEDEFVPNVQREEAERFEAEEQSRLRSSEEIGEIMSSLHDHPSALDINSQIESTGTVSAVHYTYEEGSFVKEYIFVDGSTAREGLEVLGSNAREHPDIDKVGFPGAEEGAVAPSEDDPLEILSYLQRLRYFAYQKIDGLTDDEFEYRLWQRYDDSLVEVMLSELNTIANLKRVTTTPYFYVNVRPDDELEILSQADGKFVVRFAAYHGETHTGTIEAVLAKGDDGLWRFSERIDDISNN